jgi:signal transduction histidine kinase
MRRLASLIIGFALLFGSVAMADERGSADQAKALALKAAALFDSRGDTALDAFNADKASFVDRDLYITVVDMQGFVRASSGPSAALIGKNTMDAEDPDGKKFVQEFFKTTAGESHEGWLTYKYIDPITKKIAQKKTFVRRAGGYIITCGSYVAI